MSNFLCDKCGTEILENESGHFATGCEHYPLPATCKCDNGVVHETIWGRDGYPTTFRAIKCPNCRPATCHCELNTKPTCIGFVQMASIDADCCECEMPDGSQCCHAQACHGGGK